MRTLDDIRKDRERSGATVNAVNVAGSDKPAPKVIKDAFAALNTFADEFVMYRDRVAELDERVSGRDEAVRTIRAERDEALAKAREHNIDRRSEKNRADRLQREVDWYKDQRRETLEAIGRVARERDHARASVETLGADVDRLARERDEALARAHRHGDAVRLAEDLAAARKLRDEALNRVEVIARERDEAVAERDGRFTSDQVAHYQTTEAELVSRPLRVEIDTLRVALDREVAANSSLANQAADELAARREAESRLYVANERIAELQRWLDCRQAAQNRAEAEAARHRTTVERIRLALTKIADTVAAGAISQALDPENPDYETDPSRAALRDLARQVRHEIRKVYGLPGARPTVPDSTWDGPTCGPQCLHEGSPGSPTE